MNMLKTPPQQPFRHTMHRFRNNMSDYVSFIIPLCVLVVNAQWQFVPFRVSYEAS